MSEVVLLSGGIDSLVCAEQSRRADRLAGCVFIDYGHPAQIPEGWKAFAYCGNRGVRLKVVHAFGLSLGDMGTGDGARVVPNRNAILLALAANAAVELGSNTLVIGCNAEDQADYVDCRAPFITGMAAVLGMRVAAPLLGMRKDMIIREARRLGLSESDAWACYTAGPEACGVCPSCVQSKAAWSGE